MTASIRPRERGRLLRQAVLLAVLAWCAAGKTAKGRARGDCVTFVPLHKVFMHPANALPFSDGRSLRGELYSIGGCPTYRHHESGTRLSGNNTLLSQGGSLDGPDCLITTNRNKDAVYTSMQAFVVRTNDGFLLDAVSIDVGDVDSQGDTTLAKASQESMAVFGMSGGNYVAPDLKFYADSVIEEREYLVPSQAMFDLGFARQHVYVTGVQFAADAPHDCRSKDSREGALRCTATASFSEGLDALVVMHALTQKSKTEAFTFGLVSELRLRC